MTATMGTATTTTPVETNKKYYWKMAIVVVGLIGALIGGATAVCTGTNACSISSVESCQQSGGSNVSATGNDAGNVDSDGDVTIVQTNNGDVTASYTGGC